LDLLLDSFASFSSANWFLGFLRLRLVRLRFLLWFCFWPWHCFLIRDIIRKSRANLDCDILRPVASRAVFMFAVHQHVLRFSELLLKYYFGRWLRLDGGPEIAECSLLDDISAEEQRCGKEEDYKVVSVWCRFRCPLGERGQIHVRAGLERRNSGHILMPDDTATDTWEDVSNMVHSMNTSGTQLARWPEGPWER